MSLFFSADPHYGHAKVIGYTGRPHVDVDAMNADLIDRWNDTVEPGDDVWVLGDFALGRRGDTLPLVARLHGTKHLLPGNHDGCWPGHRQRDPRSAAVSYRNAGFASILDDPTWLEIAGRDVTFSHFPYAGGGTPETEPYDERYAEHRPIDRGGWLVHGHIHQHWRTRGRQINVGVDAWGGYPVPLTVIEDYVRADRPAHEPPIPWEPA